MNSPGINPYRTENNLPETDLADISPVHPPQYDSERQVQHQDHDDRGEHVDVLQQLVGAVIEHRAEVYRVGRHEPVRAEQRQMSDQAHRLRG